jgi:hypothetical protein
MNAKPPKEWPLALMSSFGAKTIKIISKKCRKALKNSEKISKAKIYNR